MDRSMLRSAAFSAALVLAWAIWAAWPRTGAALTSGSPAAEIAGDNWINSKPLTINSLKGRVVLIEFWTYG